MALLIRELQRSAKGPVANNEDWWRLVFDTDTKRLYIAHEWQHTAVRGAGCSDSGKEQIEITSISRRRGKRLGTANSGASFKPYFARRTDVHACQFPGLTISLGLLQTFAAARPRAQHRLAPWIKQPEW